MDFLRKYFQCITLLHPMSLGRHRTGRWVAARETPNISIYNCNLSFKDRVREDEHVIVDAGYEDATVVNAVDVLEYVHYHSAVRGQYDWLTGNLKGYMFYGMCFATAWSCMRCFYILWRIFPNRDYDGRAFFRPCVVTASGHCVTPPTPSYR